MKFDDAIQIIDGMTMISGGFGISPDVAKRIIEDLRGEYAPTILLTKNQDKELKAGHTLEEKIARIQRLADNSSDDNADGYINDDMIMRSYLYPETIKVTNDEEN